ncbi:MAG TPA: hypothetical protein VEI25_13660 [Paraburkholderia sp.]|nr:hypothetical protein [Paraburkholderia sp.]
MIEAHYWWHEADRFKEAARRAGDEKQRSEFLELAATCEAVAIEVEDRATGG